MARTPTRAQAAAFDALLATADADVRAAFLAAVYAARGRVDLGGLIALLEANDVAGAVEMLRFDQAVLWPLEEAVRRSYLSGGAAVDGFAPSGIEGRFGFNARHPRAEADIARIGGDLIGQIEQQQVEAVRAVILDGMENNRGSRPVALDITGRLSRATGRREGGIIGLTGDQADWVINARRDLEGLDRSYFQRALRDKRFDGTVRKAIEAGKPLAAADVDRITGRYKDRVLDYRGKLIARNEAHTAQAAGRHEAYRQMLDRPDIEAVTCRWIHGFSREARPDHKRMDGEVRSFGEGFVMDDGTVMQYPHDPAGGVRHSASCRCTAFYRAIPRRS
ncbi:hypothetical protein E4191_07625 [Paracoccus liaowanqingii]|uniref:Phage head morphogenesis domain-containing protein n=1 Tax=Paracoccus liaowanqingii TaxID=2560053 RepID=A0A4P7HKB1_9RHOB|nr:phage minor head protein [Paracoccus liaowanqingii]QBX34594.1 hypothetical protein E4191_07625 [Paracoccus liaowanqingii]